MKDISVLNMTKQIVLMKRLCAVASLGALVSCGGGGSATGGLTTFSVVPIDWTLSFGEGNTFCEVDSVDRPSLTVTVVGGTPPYRIVNAKPQKLAVNTTTLDGKNPSFVVTALGGCGDALNILVLDSLSRSVSFKATLEAGEVPVVVPVAAAVPTVP